VKRSKEEVAEEEVAEEGEQGKNKERSKSEPLLEQVYYVI
jgi:hypothetical protein